MKINNTGIFCCYFSTSFRSANPNFGLRPKLGGQISLWTERKDSAKRLIQKVKSLNVTAAKTKLRGILIHPAIWLQIAMWLTDQLTDQPYAYIRSYIGTLSSMSVAFP